jgi:hypothetical protein
MSKKFYRKPSMKFLVLVFAAATAGAAAAQNRMSGLDRAYEDARAAAIALKEAQARRDLGIEPQEGDRQGTSSGGTRATPQHLGRAALKRWNDLK